MLQNCYFKYFTITFFHVNEGDLNSRPVEKLVNTDVYSVHFDGPFWEPATFSA